MKNDQQVIQINKLTNEIEHLKSLLNDINWKDTAFYELYLAQTFYYVKHSTRLLALSASRLDFDNHQKSHLRFIAHLKEESGHEAIVLNDLKNLNRDIRSIPEFFSTKALYQMQYYAVEHHHALSLLGYILFLECLASMVGPGIYQSIKHHYKPQQLSFLKLHAEEDPDHVSKAIELIEHYPKELQEIIWQHFKMSQYFFTQWFADLKNQQKLFQVA